MAEVTEGVCDLCGKEADAKYDVSLAYCEMGVQGSSGSEIRKQQQWQGEGECLLLSWVPRAPLYSMLCQDCVL
jgi:hypothetical protein